MCSILECRCEIDEYTNSKKPLLARIVAIQGYNNAESDDIKRGRKPKLVDQHNQSTINRMDLMRISVSVLRVSLGDKFKLAT